MKKSVLLGATVSAVFVFAMMTNPVFAVSSNLKIASVDEFSMTVKGGHPGTNEDGHAIVVYGFFTDTNAPKKSFVAYVAATHSSFDDDPEQADNIRALHAHKLHLNKDTLCITALFESPDVSVDGSTISIPDATGDVVNWVIAGYDVTGSAGGLLGGEGICPTEVYDFV